ncbi:MAG: LysE family translocator [Nitratireductor sp.]|nr:LysE family translocator [Nitratireductor sp.]
MPLETFWALLVFAFVASMTPGPNNLMLLASGVNFGFRRTVPHMLGIATGFTTLLLAVGFGLGALLHALPALGLALKVAGGAFLLYLAWQIAFSRSMGNVERASHPISFAQAWSFQWVNPKAWVMSLTAMAVYGNAEQPVLSVLVVTSGFTLLCFVSVFSWTGFGQLLRGFLADPARLKWFNIVMGLALALTLVPMLA